MNSSNPEALADQEPARKGVLKSVIDAGVLGFFTLGTAVNAAIFGVGVGIEINGFTQEQTLPPAEDLETIGMSAAATLIFAGLSVLQYRNMTRQQQQAAEHIS